MAGPERRSSMGVDRRASQRLSNPLQHNITRFDDSEDDDDYNLAAMGISDGFRPSGSTNGHNRMSSEASQHFTTGRRTPPPRPSSTTKPKALDSFALRHDGGMGADARRSSMAASNYSPRAPSISSSISTDIPYMRPESPYRGPSGPSHPYQMYPQESRLARTASIATTATIPVPDRPYNGPGGPTHPYGMYPQNTVPEAESPDEPSPVAPVTVGFPGLRSDYQRRLGPEGEEIADIIGPDGHTEQLPPYTKYPNEAFARKTRPTVTIPLAGAGGIGLATRNPEFASREDLNSPSRQSTRTVNSANSEHQVNMAAVPMSEKPELKKWQKAARRKLCGIIPVWVTVLIALVFIMFGIILGTLLAVLGPDDSDEETPSGKPPLGVVATFTTTFDAMPLTASPAGIPDLPTGTYALPISAPSAIQNSCLSSTQESAAWSCSIPMLAYNIAINSVDFAPSDVANNEIRLSPGNTPDDSYAFGSQPPVFSEFQILNLVMDNQDPGKGPAWFFEIPYNKLVILPEEAITAPGAKGKRDHHGEKRLGGGGFVRKDVAEPGDRPWFCHWNGTLLEGFIYVNLTSSAGRSASASPASVSATPTSTVSSGRSTSSATPAAVTGSSFGFAQPFEFPPAYPMVLKIEERRVPDFVDIAPYCVQHVIDDWGVASIAKNSTGQPVIVYLNETDSSIMPDMGSKRSNHHKRDDTDIYKRNIDSMACGCVWLWT
ncbi:hypothetical protein VTL71DRAFT_6092 [Oculimacula yallundae]|uniref:DUF7820 domain-containing protein n=1 Tax=Oculimacula yallundae TaxID=86028 RepID=A0ABR4BZH0_9HELO